MIRIQKILVPVDFSESSKKAVNYGISLAMQFKARLMLAHITGFDKQEYDDAKVRLFKLIPPEYIENLNFEIIVNAGDVRHQIPGIVEAREIDLVIMGSRGRTYFERVLLGSVTERMLRKLQVPILTVSHLAPENEIQKPGDMTISRILYATDLSDGSEAGMEFSVRLARGLEAALTVVHVLEPMDVAFSGVETAMQVPDYAIEARAQAEERLHQSVAGFANEGVPISTILAEGFPCEEIENVAEKDGSDLIVMNLQPKGVVERALLGTTAERLVRTSRVPVLSLPLPAAYASRWAAA